MKIPLPKDDIAKGIMMSGSSTGRKELIHELRETSLIGGNALQRRDMVDKAVQYIGNMDLGSGDTSDFVFGNRNNYDSINEGFQYDSPIHQSIETPMLKIHVMRPLLSPQPPPSPTTHHELRETGLINGNVLQRRDMIDKSVQYMGNVDLKSGDTSDLVYPPLSSFTPPIGKTHSLSPSSSSSGSINSTGLHDKFDSDHFFKGKENKSTETNKGDCTVVVVEEGSKPNFRANESNPTVPSMKEPSKTNTLRLSDRPRSESEDDIEKVDDSDQEHSIFNHGTLYKTKAITEESQNSEKMDKNGNKPDVVQNDVENDCIVECLYYTIHCCECVTF